MPFKLIVMVSLGAMYAVTIGATAIASGARCDVFPYDFADTLKAMMHMTKKVREPLEVIMPLNTNPGEQGKVNDRVFEIIKHEPLWKQTSYCNEYPACEKCYGCRLRAEWLAR